MYIYENIIKIKIMVIYIIFKNFFLENVIIDIINSFIMGVNLNNNVLVNIYIYM